MNSSNRQHGFTHTKSTGTVLVNLCFKNVQNIQLVIFTDLKKASDAIDHGI